MADGGHVIIDGGAQPIDGPIQIRPVAADLDAGLIHAPAARWPTSGVSHPGLAIKPALRMGGEVEMRDNLAGGYFKMLRPA